MEVLQHSLDEDSPCTRVSNNGDMVFHYDSLCGCLQKHASIPEPIILNRELIWLDAAVDTGIARDLRLVNYITNRKQRQIQSRLVSYLSTGSAERPLEKGLDDLITAQLPQRMVNAVVKHSMYEPIRKVYCSPNGGSLEGYDDEQLLGMLLLEPHRPGRHRQRLGIHQWYRKRLRLLLLHSGEQLPSRTKLLSEALQLDRELRARRLLSIIAVIIKSDCDGLSVYYGNDAEHYMEDTWKERLRIVQPIAVLTSPDTEYMSVARVDHGAAKKSADVRAYVEEAINSGLCRRAALESHPGSETLWSEAYCSLLWKNLRERLMPPEAG